MKTHLIAFLISICSITASAVPQLPKEPERDVAEFFTPLKAEGAYLAFDKIWGNFPLDEVSDKNLLKGALQKQGPIKVIKVARHYESGGGRILKISYDLVFKSGYKLKAELSYLKRLNSPYTMYDLQISN